MRHVVLFIVLIISVSKIQAQFSGTNLMEYQYGKLPDSEDENFHALYNKLRLNYRFKGLKVNAGVQFYQTPYSERNYVDASWLGLNYRKKGWEFKAGNFNETLGRGILLRSYEIQGAILEDKGYRSKQYFYRDILGASVGFKNKKFSVKALWGYALNNVYPPTEEWDKRRSDELAAFYGDYTLYKQTIGASVIRIKNSLEDSYYGMGSMSGRIWPFLNYYSAYAVSLNGKDGGFDAQTHAIYGSLNLALSKFGVSLEVKDYNNFLLGSGINEPPALIREHSYRVLNRSTHVLQPQNETGFQVEAFYQPSINTVLTLNHTRANNDFGITFDYKEWFFELSTMVGELTEFKGFMDYADDPFKGEMKRYSGGVNVDRTIKNDYGLKLEVELQTFDREGKSTQNYVGGLTFRYKSKLFVNALSEWSNDAFVTDSKKIWLGSNVRYKLNGRNNLQLFAGERRGGPACSAGICYEVLDFKGVELRWTSRF
ncbi:DUF6029 family protein [Carboxylicivirga sp. N1Y90]|uniref:DUF6029 family protein n=1 Tax=Carboxylicivirga fragile TaxID=3417571 RepID=UPI003D33BF19|nr:hypothetical protein [Marinilabiliaceae bacterium N1Y90]